MRNRERQKANRKKYRSMAHEEARRAGMDNITGNRETYRDPTADAAMRDIAVENRKKALAAARAEVRRPLSYEKGPVEKDVKREDGSVMHLSTHPTGEKMRAQGITAVGSALIHGEPYPVQVRRKKDAVQIVIGTKVCEFHVPREDELNQCPDGFDGKTVRELQNMGIGLISESHLDLENGI